jgi:sporulation protein YlmC with PRC-barrel domain
MKFRIHTPCQAGTNPQAHSLSVILELLGGQRFRRGYRLAIFSATGVVLGLLAVTAVSHPGLSQGVQLVKVDIEVVEHGYRISKLSGHAVVNDKNERIGKIDDFVIGQDEGHPVFTVLEIGDFLGIGSHLVAVPYDSMIIDRSGNKIDKIALPGASKEELKKLAEFRYGS